MREQDRCEFTSLCEKLTARLVSASVPVNFSARDKQAAVALILRRNLEAAELLVIKRAENPRDHWSGHLALPGGRHEADDPDLRFTAIRETFEEVGINLASGGEILGRLETINPRSPLAPPVSVTPFVAVAPPPYHILTHGAQPPDLKLSPEVQFAFWVPLALLKQRGAVEVYRLVVGQIHLEWPAYATEHGLIWGLTERILTEFIGII